MHGSRIIGAWLVQRESESANTSEEKKKPRGEVIKYSPEFLMKFAEVCSVWYVKNACEGMYYEKVVFS